MAAASSVFLFAFLVLNVLRDSKWVGMGASKKGETGFRWFNMANSRNTLHGGVC